MCCVCVCMSVCVCVCCVYVCLWTHTHKHTHAHTHKHTHACTHTHTRFPCDCTMTTADIVDVLWLCDGLLLLFLSLPLWKAMSPMLGSGRKKERKNVCYMCARVHICIYVCVYMHVCGICICSTTYGIKKQ